MELQKVSLAGFLTVLKASISFDAVLNNLIFCLVFHFADDVEHDWEVQQKNWDANNLLKGIDVSEKRHFIISMILPDEVKAKPSVQ